MAPDANFHVFMGTIFAQEVDSPLFKALEKAGVNDVKSITSLSDQAIDQLKCQDHSSGTDMAEALGHGNQQLVRCFKAFVIMKNDKGAPLHGDWQNLVLKDNFREFRVIGFASHAHRGTNIIWARRMMELM
jgi:hypothetical protein